MKSGCIFCGISNKEIKADILYEDDDILVFKDINPRAPVHLLFIPREHIETLNDLKHRQDDLMAKIFRKIPELAMKEGVSESGYRVVVNCNRNAGQDVFHIHFHLLGGRIFSWPPG